MSAQDALWLTMDRPNNLMIIDVAIVLAGTPSMESVLDGFRALVERHPVFGRRAQRHGATWAWVDDADFDLRRHVLEVRLDGCPDMAAVQRQVARLRSTPLDRERPLWTSTLIGPVALADGTVGSVIVTRFHHAIADGVRLTQVMLGMLDPTSAGQVPAVARSAPPGTGLPGPQAVRDGVAEATRVSVNAARGIVGAVGRAVTHPRATVVAGWEAVRHPDRVVDAFQGLGADDHRAVNDATSVGKLALGGTERTVWTGRPGREKAVAWSDPLPLGWVKQVARAHGATVNDVLVAALAGALRSYLEGRGDSVAEVVWMVPVNLKPFDDELPEDLGNHFALVLLDMPLSGETSDARIDDLRGRMQRIKNSDEPVLTYGLQRAISLSPHLLATAATDFFANKAVGVLTNVPGPTVELAFAGVPVRQVIGFAPCSGDQPLTATIFTYNGTVTVGFASDAGLVPDPQTLVRLVRDEIDEMCRSSA